MPVPERGVVYVETPNFERVTTLVAVHFMTSPPRFTASVFEEILSRRWVDKLQYGSFTHGQRTQLIAAIQAWNAVHDPIIKPVAPAPAPAPATARFPAIGYVSLEVIRDGETWRLAMGSERPHGTLNVFFLTSIDGHNAGDYIQIADGLWVSNSHPIDPSLLPHVLAEIERWKAEQSPKIENKPPAYSGENKGSPDAMIAWLRRDKSALATDAADEIERLRGWLLRMYEQAARNNWHIYSCVAHDALTGKPVPERKVQV